MGKPSDRYQRSKHLAAKNKYAFLTLRIPHEDLKQVHALVAAGKFPSINEAIITFVVWGVETASAGGNK